MQDFVHQPVLAKPDPDSLGARKHGSSVDFSPLEFPMQFA